MTRSTHGDPLRQFIVPPHGTSTLFDGGDSLGANYIADEGTVRCGLCEQRVNAFGLCPDCDSGEIERREERDDADYNPERT